MELGRVKTRILGYYTNVGGTTADLPTDKLPWATVLQHTHHNPGNDGQGESSGQLQLVLLLWVSSWMEKTHRCLLLLVCCV